MTSMSVCTSDPILPAALAELVGTFILVFGGTAVAVGAILSRPTAGAAYDSLAVALAFGLALAAVVAAIGHVSGAHVNPRRHVGDGLNRQVPVEVRALLPGRPACRGSARGYWHLDRLRRARQDRGKPRGYLPGTGGWRSPGVRPGDTDHLYSGRKIGKVEKIFVNVRGEPEYLAAKIGSL
jgi:hypothetical protein